MAEASVPVKYLDDITECPICTNIFTDPRELPCVHTFCLKCIEGWAAQRKSPEQKLVCPLCRKETTLSGDQAVTQLPKNLFVERLLEVKKLSTRARDERVLCEVCDKQKPGGPGAAVIYCADCRQNICKECSVTHKNIRVLASHRLIELGRPMKADDLLVKIGVDMCEKHSGKPLEIFCSECKLVMCMMCYIKEHKSHDCSDVIDAAEGLKRDMETCMDNVSKKGVACKNLLLVLAEKENGFLNEVSKTEKEIEDKAEEMKRAIDERRRQLLDELQAVKRMEHKEIENLRHEFDGQLMMIESWIAYSEQLREKGSACDIAREVGSLCARAKELLDMGSTDQRDILTRDSTRVSFKTSRIVDNLKQILGQLTFTKVSDNDKTPDDNFLSCTKPLNVIPSTGKSVTGLVTHNNELFVTRYDVKHVDVFCVETFNLKRQLKLSAAATGSYYGVTVCPTLKCVFISDDNAALLHKVDVDAKIPASHWSTGANPRGVSLNRTQNGNNILVACRSADKIQEFTPSGVLIREISLGPNITGLVHVVQLNNDIFGVLHNDNYHRYCEIDSSGKIIRSFGGGAGSSDRQLNNPCRCDVGKNGCVFIADCGNNRVVLLNSSNFSVQELSIEGGVVGPHTIHVDKSRGRLYIGEWNRCSKRIIVLGSK